jgi:hypothetical protein
LRAALLRTVVLADIGLLAPLFVHATGRAAVLTRRDGGHLDRWLRRSRFAIVLLPGRSPAAALLTRFLDD